MQAFHLFLRPGMAVMRSMRFSVKLGLLLIATVIPLGYMGTQLTLRLVDDRTTLRQEAAGMAAINELFVRLPLLQEARDAALASASATAGPSVARGTSTVVDDAVGARLRALQAPGLLTEWTQLQMQMSAAASGGSDASGRAQTAAIAALEAFVFQVGRVSTLIFDADPASYLLIDGIVSRDVALAEELWRLARDGNFASAAAVQRLLARNEAVTRALDELGVRLPALNGLRDEAQALSRLLGEARPDAAAVQAAAQRAAAAQRKSAAAARAQVLDLLESRSRSNAASFFWVHAIGGATVALVLYLMLAFNASFMADLRQVMAFMRETASGNLSYKPRVMGHDELSQMTDSMDTMVVNISSIVATIRSNSALVSHSGGMLVDESHALSERTEQQAANLEQTAASVEQLASTVQGNAHSAHEADEAARSVSDLAERGAHSVMEAVGAVETIEASTHRMDEIISVIDGLAFQTNILALNAAVEAARAGESGRGFAVVASEVRALAQRSANSAREIRELIAESTQQVRSGVTHIRSAGDVIRDVATGVKRVAAVMSDISISSAEQSRGLLEISEAVKQLDAITQANAALVEHSVVQATALERRASTLVEGVSLFHLQQGSADEAHALVDRALELRTRVGSREAFLQAITDARSGLADRDMYVFALNDSGTYLAFAGNPAKVGTRVHDIPGVDGQRLIDSIVAQADQGAGWVEYDIVNPKSGQVQPKMSYVQRCEGVIVGCGVYKNLLAVA